MAGPTTFSEFEQIICGELRKMRLAAAVSDGGPDQPDCWTLVEPDWKRLDELDNGEFETQGHLKVGFAP